MRSDLQGKVRNNPSKAKCAATQGKRSDAQGKVRSGA
jgi:hypothetical protein